jgi:hypothetical protein
MIYSHLGKARLQQNLQQMYNNTPAIDIEAINGLNKAEELGLLDYDATDIEKGRKGMPIGAKAVWGGVSYLKTAQGWKPVGKHRGNVKDNHDLIHNNDDKDKDHHSMVMDAGKMDEKEWTAKHGSNLHNKYKQVHDYLHKEKEAKPKEEKREEPAEDGKKAMEIAHIEAVLRNGATNDGKISDSFRQGLEKKLKELKGESDSKQPEKKETKPEEKPVAEKKEEPKAEPKPVDPEAKFKVKSADGKKEYDLRKPAYHKDFEDATPLDHKKIMEKHAELAKTSADPSLKRWHDAESLAHKIKIKDKSSNSEKIQEAFSKLDKEKTVEGLEKTHEAITYGSTPYTIPEREAIDKHYESLHKKLSENKGAKEEKPEKEDKRVFGKDSANYVEPNRIHTESEIKAYNENPTRYVSGIKDQIDYAVKEGDKAEDVISAYKDVIDKMKESDSDDLYYYAEYHEEFEQGELTHQAALLLSESKSTYDKADKNTKQYIFNLTKQSIDTNKFKNDTDKKEAAEVFLKYMQSKGSKYRELKSKQPEAKKEESKPEPVEEKKDEPKKAEVTDPSEVQKYKDAIREGEAMLSAGKSNGKKLTSDQKVMITNSVNSSRAKIGLPPYEEPKKQEESKPVAEGKKDSEKKVDENVSNIKKDTTFDSSKTENKMPTFKIVNEDKFKLNVDATENAKSASIMLAAAKVHNNNNDVIFDFGKDGLTANEAFRAKSIQIATETEDSKKIAEILKEVSKFNSDSVLIKPVSITDFGYNKIVLQATGKGTFGIKDKLKADGFKWATTQWEKVIYNKK